MAALVRFALGFLLVIISSAAWSQSPNPPIGNAESVYQSGSSYVTVGWSCDPDDYWTALAMHFYLDGDYSTGTFVGAVGAYDNRGDLTGVCGGSPYHGYTFTIPSQYLTPGQHTIYAYALDNGGAGPNPLMGALSFTVSAPAASSPIGNAESVSLSGGSYVTVGWACDPDDYWTALGIHFYLDGTYATGTFVGGVGAYDYRGDLTGVCGGSPYHGYTFTIPSQYLTNAGWHSIYAYAQDNTGAAAATMVGALSFYVSTGQTPNAPYGFLESISPSGSAFVASGWACDQDDWSASLQLQFYVDNAFVGNATANAYRPDLGNQCAYTTAHGFNFTLAGMAPGTHTISVYAVDNGNITTAQLYGSPGYVTVPQPPRTDLLYGYFSGSACGPYASEQQGHINLWWATDCMGSGVWANEMQNSLAAGRAAGATTAVLSLWSPVMVFGSDAETNARNWFTDLAATNALDGFSTIVIYPVDEPEQNKPGQPAVSDQEMLQALQMLRGVIAGIPKLAQAKFGVFYNCNSGSRPGLSSFDWIGCDNYDAGCNAIDQLTDPNGNFQIRSDQRYMIIPGGADPWHEDPTCAVQKAQANSRIVAVVPFIWQTVTDQGNTYRGIRENGMRSAYCQAGRTLTGQNGSC